MGEIDSHLAICMYIQVVTKAVRKIHESQETEFIHLIQQIFIGHPLCPINALY